MNKTVMSVKTDKKLKEQAQKIAKEMGFPLGTLINAYLRQFVKSKTVYFTALQSTTMTKALESELKQIEEDIQNEVNLSPEFKDMKDAIKYLKKNDS